MKEKVFEVINNNDLSFKKKIAEIEKLIMIDALERNNWVKIRAAKDLKVTYRIFNYKYQNYNLDKYKNKGGNNKKQNNKEVYV